MLTEFESNLICFVITSFIKESWNLHKMFSFHVKLFWVNVP
jgi:hypothetical protein